MLSIKIVFLTFIAAVIAYDDHGSSYHINVKHDHYPKYEHHDGHSYIHSKPVAVLAYHGGYGGGESYSHGGHDDHKDYHHHPSYKFEYGVKDPKTGDHHAQWEHRDGDKVEGEYSLDEADGTKRVVKYSADKHNGFTAHVEKIGHAHHHHGHHY